MSASSFLRWPDHADAIVRDMWPTSKAAVIAEHVSRAWRPVTRNGVIGRAHKMKLSDKRKRPGPARVPPPKKPSWWDAENRAERLKILWLDGKSALEICKTLNTSRMAVISKANRMGLSREPGSVNKAQDSPRPPRVLAANLRKPDDGDALRLTILDLRGDSCRWMIGDGFYCGKPKVRGSYCAGCAAVAYMPVKG